MTEKAGKGEDKKRKCTFCALTSFTVLLTTKILVLPLQWVASKCCYIQPALIFPYIWTVDLKKKNLCWNNDMEITHYCWLDYPKLSVWPFEYSNSYYYWWIFLCHLNQNRRILSPSESTLWYYSITRIVSLSCTFALLASHARVLSLGALHGRKTALQNFQKFNALLPHKFHLCKLCWLNYYLQQLTELPDLLLMIKNHNAPICA